MRIARISKNTHFYPLFYDQTISNTVVRLLPFEFSLFFGIHVADDTLASGLDWSARRWRSDDLSRFSFTRIGRDGKCTQSFRFLHDSWIYENVYLWDTNARDKINKNESIDESDEEGDDGR